MFLVRLNLHEQGDDTWVDVAFNGDDEWELPSSWTREVGGGGGRPARPPHVPFNVCGVAQVPTQGLLRVRYCTQLDELEEEDSAIDRMYEYREQEAKRIGLAFTR
jgi:hypothetical protein